MNDKLEKIIAELRLIGGAEEVLKEAEKMLSLLLKKLKSDKNASKHKHIKEMKGEPPIALKHMFRDVKPRGPRKTIPMAKMRDVGKVEEPKTADRMEPEKD